MVSLGIELRTLCFWGTSLKPLHYRSMALFWGIGHIITLHLAIVRVAASKSKAWFDEDINFKVFYYRKNILYWYVHISHFFILQVNVSGPTMFWITTRIIKAAINNRDSLFAWFAKPCYMVSWQELTRDTPPLPINSLDWLQQPLRHCKVVLHHYHLQLRNSCFAATGMVTLLHSVYSRQQRPTYIQSAPKKKTRDVR